MRMILFVLVLCAISLLALAAQSAENDATPRVKEAAPETYRWVNDGGPYGGTVRALSLCASRPEVVYAACPHGVYKSTDGAASWHLTASLLGDGRPTPANDVVVDPRDPDVVYASRGGTAKSIYKSTDGGASWKALEPDSDGWSCAPRIEIDPKNPDTIYVADRARGAFKSTDGGKTWELKNNGLSDVAFTHFEIDPRFPQTLSCVTGAKGWEFMSTDSGATWRNVGHFGTVWDDPNWVSVSSFTREEARPTAITLVLTCGGNPIHYESQDDGATWQAKGRAPSGLHPQALTRLNKDDPKQLRLSVRQDALLYLTRDGAQTWRMSLVPFDARTLVVVRVAGDQGDLLYAATRDGTFYFSDDAGESWDFFYSAESDPGGQQTTTLAELRKHFLHGLGLPAGKARTPYGHDIAIHPSDHNIVYCVGDGDAGVLKTDDFGTTWVQSDAGLIASGGLMAFGAGSIACDSKTPGLLYTLGRSTIHKSIDGGRTWSKIRAGNQTCWGPFIIHPLDPRTLLVGEVSEAFSLAVTTDGGQTWTETPPWERTIAEAFVFDPENADTFYALTFKPIFKTADRGRTWSSASGTMPPRAMGFGAEMPGLHQTSAEIIYATGGRTSLLRSTDVGETWEELKSFKTDASIKFVDAHPVDPKIVAVATRDGRLHLSRDAGETWRTVQIPGHFADNGWSGGCLGMHPTDPDVFYVGGYDNFQGVLRTRDGGKTFEALNNGLPRVRIGQIVVSPTDGTVYAATDGAGVYRLETEPASSD
jgi:photosystem II stability/assembly factor-like uncharacterized protein